LPAAAGNHRRM